MVSLPKLPRASLWNVTCGSAAASSASPWVILSGDGRAVRLEPRSKMVEKQEHESARRPAAIGSQRLGANPYRSLLFLSCKGEGALEDPGRFGADILILDLEDGVPPEEKEERRRQISDATQAGAFRDLQVFVRVNELDSLKELQRDLDAFVTEGVTGFVLPMLRDEGDVVKFEKLVTAFEEARSIPPKTFKFLPLLETPAAILHAEEIALASDRNVALGFGHADLTNITGSSNSKDALLGPRSKVVLAAHSAGLFAIETPYLQLSNSRGFEAACLEAKSLGFSGMWLVHPAQVAPANRIFSPRPEEVKWARRVLSRSQGELARTSQYGRMIGLPMVSKAQRIQAQAAEAGTEAVEFEGVSGETLLHGVDLDLIRVGQVLESPHEITVDDSWRTTWHGSFHTPDRLFTSATYAEALGFEGSPLPAPLVLNLDLCMSVEPFSESCLLHLGLHEVRYLRPAYSGDTFRNFIRVEALRNTSNGRQSVIRTTHWLVNQRDEPVFSLVKMSFYPHIDGLDERERVQEELPFAVPEPGGETELRAVLSGAGDRVLPAGAVHRSLVAGRLHLHQRVRPLGVTENLYLSTLFRNTHPIHSDYQAYAPEQIIVCGGFVMSMVMAAGSRDLCQVLDEEIVHCSHINPVNPTDNIGALSYVIDVQPAGDHLEEVTLKTLGLRNTNVEVDLAGVKVPLALLGIDHPKPSEVESICDSLCPPLRGRIALQMTRKLLRPAVVEA